MFLTVLKIPDKNLDQKQGMSVRDSVSVGHCQCGKKIVGVFFSLVIVSYVKTDHKMQNNLVQEVLRYKVINFKNVSVGQCQCQCRTLIVSDSVGDDKT